MTTQMLVLVNSLSFVPLSHLAARSRLSQESEAEGGPIDYK